MRFSLAACAFFPLCVESAGRRLRGTAHLFGSPVTSATKVYGEERELEEEIGIMNMIDELEDSLGLDNDRDGDDGDDDADNQSSDAAGPDDPATNSTLEQGIADVNGSEPIDDLSTTPAEPSEAAVLGNPEPSNVTMPNPDVALYGSNTAISDTFGTVDPPLDPSFDSILNDTTTRSADRLPEDTPIDDPSLDAPGNPQDLSGTSSSSGTGPETTATSPADTAASLDAMYPSATASNLTTEDASDQEAVGSNSAPEVVPPASSEEAAGSNSAPEVVPPASSNTEATGIDSAPEVVPLALRHKQATGSYSAPEAAPPASPYEDVTGIRSAPDFIPYASSHEQTADSNPEHGTFPAGHGNSKENPVSAGNGHGSAPEVPPAGDSSSTARGYSDEIPTRDKRAEPERPSTVIDASEEQTDDDNDFDGADTDDANDFDGADTDDAEAEPNEEIHKEDNPWKDPKWADKTPEEVAALAKADALHVLKAKYVPLMLITMSLLSTAFTLFVVQQMVENPNGTTAKTCQCMVAVARIVTFPFRYLMCGAECSSGAHSRRRDRRTHDVLRNEVLRNRNGEFS
jgi:hypothetical protein